MFLFADEYGVVTGGGGNDHPYSFERNIVCMRRGVPVKNVKEEVVANGNLYWQKEDPDKLRDWLAAEKSKGREVNSIVADPQFIDIELLEKVQCQLSSIKYQGVKT